MTQLARLASFAIASLLVTAAQAHDVIGAIGVGGAPGGHLDEQCAVAGLDKVRDLLK